MRQIHNMSKPPFSKPLLMPDPDAEGLTTTLSGIDAQGQPIELPVVTEKPVTIFLNKQEIVTSMTIGDHPQALAVGFLYNQNMLHSADEIAAIDYDPEIDVVVVRTHEDTNFEEKLKKRIRTSGCAQGTIFGDIMDRFEQVNLSAEARIHTSELIALSKAINTAPSLYLKAGAIHGCVLAKQAEPLLYVEDIGRHNAVDKIAGMMLLEAIDGADKIFYTTGRLTSEMVLKTAIMGIPILVSRSGFTAAGVALARQANMTLIGRAKGSRFVALSGHERIIFDQKIDASALQEGVSAQRQKT